MNETEYWEHLEFRVSHEFAGMPENHLRYFWCDGFIPEEYLLQGQSPCISGWAWICNGQKAQEQWQFTLFLDHPVASPDEINWPALLPPHNVTEWMAVDLAHKWIQIEPSAAVADALDSDGISNCGNQ